MKEISSVFTGRTSCAYDMIPNKNTAPVKTIAMNELKHLLIIWIVVGFRKGRDKSFALPFQVGIKPNGGKHIV
jgi:hypothetical protein